MKGMVHARWEVNTVVVVVVVAAAAEWVKEFHNRKTIV